MRPPEVTRPWRFVLVGIALMVVSMVGQFRVPLLPDIARDIDLTTTDLGLLTTLFAAGRLATDLPAGLLIDRLGIRRMLGVVGVLSALGSSLFAVAHSRWLVLTAAIVLGVASAVSNLAGMTYFSTNATDERRGIAMAGYGVAIRGGGAMGPVASGGIATLAGWRASMWVGGAVSALLALIVVLLRSALTRRAPVSTGPGAPVEPPSTDDEPPPGVSYSRRQRLILSFVPFTTLFAQGALLQTLMPVIGAQSLGLSTAYVGFALGVGGIARIMGTFVAGWTADRVSRKWALVPGLLIQAVATCLLVIEGAVWAWFSAIVIFSVASIGTSVAAAMLGDQAPPGQVGRQLGAFRLMGDVGLLIGPLLTAVVFDVAGQRTAMLGVATLIAACTAAAAVYLPETRTTRHIGTGQHGEPLD